ncbi:peptide-methionine (S)-S-oxide reductase MsrA [Parvularcula bermudensis]|nr:peptide-methionine (S)-S-oxide reductase MsrA [Parvularcula bermudensis]
MSILSFRPLLVSSLFLLGACSNTDAPSTSTGGPSAETIPGTAESLVVAGGCFWCVEHDMEAVPGVYEAVSGYGGGEKREATYRDHEGHREVVEIYYDPRETTYAELVHIFLRTIDPLDDGGQFCDRGYSYTTAIHYRTDAERRAAEAAIAAAEKALSREIVTPVEPISFVVEAEGYHQDYADQNPLRYKFYRTRCGRDQRVEEVWGQRAASAP